LILDFLPAESGFPEPSDDVRLDSSISASTLTGSSPAAAGGTSSSAVPSAVPGTRDKMIVDPVSNLDAATAAPAGYFVIGMPNYERTPTSVMGTSVPSPGRAHNTTAAGTVRFIESSTQRKRFSQLT
jgi:hypothetical protein